jgi:hypothetical protein
MTCTARGSGWQCDRDAERGDYCKPHYMQLRRNGELRPLRTAGDADAQVAFRCPSELRAQVEHDASTRGLTLTEWWLDAARRALIRR